MILFGRTSRRSRAGSCDERCLLTNRLAQRFKRFFAKDSLELLAIIVHKPGSLDHYVVDAPVTAVVFHLVIDRDRGLSSIDLGPDLGIVAVRDLLVIMD